VYAASEEYDVRRRNDGGALGGLFDHIFEQPRADGAEDAGTEQLAVCADE
jgi:hypothetical protein